MLRQGKFTESQQGHNSESTDTSSEDVRHYATGSAERGKNFKQQSHPKEILGSTRTGGKELSADTAGRQHREEDRQIVSKG